MALVKCKHCKKEISPNAKTCIHCGETVEPQEVEVVVLKDDGTDKAVKLLKKAAIILFILLAIDTSIDFVIRGLQALEYTVSDFESFMNASVNVIQNTLNSLVLTIFYPCVLYGLSHIIRLLDRRRK